MAVLTKEVVKKLLVGQSCSSCRCCRNFDDTISPGTNDYYQRRLKTFNGRDKICIGAGRDTQSLDERGWCENWSGNAQYIMRNK